MENTPVILGSLTDEEMMQLIVYLVNKVPDIKLEDLIKKLIKLKETKTS